GKIGSLIRARPGDGEGMVIKTFESGSLLNLLGKSMFLALLAAFTCAAVASGEDSASALNLMPLPRSITRSTGTLNLGTHFNAGFAGQHDARLDAALDRFLDRLDRQ